MNGSPRLAIIDNTLTVTDDIIACVPDWSKYAPLRRIKIAADALAEILRLHLAWLRGEGGGRRANLAGANLADANLSGANLAGAYLARADLTGANLADANLSGANLAGAYLSGAYLSDANLTGANLADANLADANLSGANLAGAYLPSPTTILLAAWGMLAPALTADLMRYDAACHPDPTAFDRWASGGECPYANVKIQRAAQFREDRKLWSPGPSPRPYDLMVAVLAEKCPEWSEEKRAEFDASINARREESERAK